MAKYETKNPSLQSNQVEPTAWPQQIILPPPPKDAYEDVDQRAETYKIQAFSDYQKDMLNIGSPKEIDPDEYAFLSSIVRADYVLKRNKVNSWQNEIEGKFKIIDGADVLTSSEKEYVRNRIINKIKDPIQISTFKDEEKKGAFTPSYEQKAFGEFISNLETPQYLNRKEALYGNGEAKGLISLLGPNALTEYPEMAKVLNHKFPNVEQKPPQSHLPSQEQIDEYNRLGGSKTKEGRKYRREFLDAAESQKVPTGEKSVSEVGLNEKILDADKAKEFLAKAKGDKGEARKLAKEAGYSF